MPSFKVLVNNEHGANMCVGIVFPEEEENGIINDILDRVGDCGFAAKSQYVYFESDSEGAQGIEDFDSELSI